MPQPSVSYSVTSHKMPHRFRAALRKRLLMKYHVSTHEKGTPKYSDHFQTMRILNGCSCLHPYSPSKSKHVHGHEYSQLLDFKPNVIPGHRCHEHRSNYQGLWICLLEQEDAIKYVHKPF
jgi:hypothetical protein